MAGAIDGAIDGAARHMTIQLVSGGMPPALGLDFIQRFIAMLGHGLTLDEAWFTQAGLKTFNRGVDRVDPATRLIDPGFRPLAVVGSLGIYTAFRSPGG